MFTASTCTPVSSAQRERLATDGHGGETVAWFLMRGGPKQEAGRQGAPMHTPSIRILHTALILACVLPVAACASDIATRYPSGAGTPQGSIVVEFSYAVSNVSITVNGELVTKDEFTDEVRIDGVPAGRIDVVVTGGDGMSEPLEKTFQVDLEPGATHTIAVAAPRVTDGAWFYLGAEFVGLALMYSSLILIL